MVRQLLIISGIFFFLCQPSFAIELDSDDDGKIDSTFVDAYTQDAVDTAFQPDLDEYSQAAAEAGTSQDEGIMTPLRLRQAIAAYLKDFYGFGTPLTSEPSGVFVGQTVLAAGYTAGWDPASQHDDSYDSAYWALCTATGTPNTWVATMRVNGEIPVQWESETYDFTTDPNCVAAYFMNGSSTTEIDRSGNGENLSQSGTIPTVSGEGDVPTAGSNVYSGSSRDFELADDPHDFLYRSDGGSTDLGSSATGLTIVAWVKPESVSNQDMVIVAKGTYSGTDGSYILRHESTDNKIYAHLTSNGTPTWTTAESYSALSEGTWAHVAVVYDKTDIRIYINGSLDSNGADNPKAYTSDIYNNTGVFRVGSYGGAAHFDGLIDEVAVFSRALSSAEISAIYSNGISGNTGAND